MNEIDFKDRERDRDFITWYILTRRSTTELVSHILDFREESQDAFMTCFGQAFDCVYN